jgi:membrane protein YdbS with pleckstrin-like domain
VGYTESLLATNETIVYRTKQHWMAPILGTLKGVAVLVGGVILFTLQLTMGTDGFVGFLRTVTFWISLALIVVGIVMVGYSYIQWWVEDYVVTNQKVVKVAGLLTKRASGAALEKITDVVMTQGPLGRILTYGTLTIATASDTSDLTYQTMRKPAEFRRTVLDEKQAWEGADARQIAAAVRETAAALPPPPAPFVAPVAAPRPADASVEEKLRQLAALRDQGLITPEDYEAKKTTILAMM